MRAVNKFGQSLPCEMAGGDIHITDPWGPPSQPGQPKVTDWGPGHADLSWQRPESDGGKAISHYQLEVRENNMTDFVKGRVFTVEEVRENKDGVILAKVEGLIEGYQYSFRVKAVNLGSTGLWNYSPPSEPSLTMTAKTRFSKAAFRQPGMYDIEVRAGKTFRCDIYFPSSSMSRYDIWCQGEPEPEVMWERNGCPLAGDESGRVTIESFVKNGVYCEKNLVVTVTRASRKEDSGDYRVRLMCGGGGTEATGRWAHSAHNLRYSTLKYDNNCVTGDVHQYIEC